MAKKVRTSKIDALVKSQNRSNHNYFHNFKFAVEYAKKSF